MMDKKSKRSSSSCRNLPCKGNSLLFSALSLRVFSEDITIFGKEVHEKYIATQKRREEAVANSTAKDESDQIDETMENENLD